MLKFLKDKPWWVSVSLAGALVIVFIYGSWQLQRWFNYSWGYESQVKKTAAQTVCEMVKPEYLKNPSRCK